MKRTGTIAHDSSVWLLYLCNTYSTQYALQRAPSLVNIDCHIQWVCNNCFLGKIWTHGYW